MDRRRLQAPNPTSEGAVTAVENYYANCLETSLPQQWGTDLLCGHAGWLAMHLIKAGDIRQIQVRQLHTKKSGFAIYIYHKQIHGMKPISIRCNMIEYWWVHLRCAGIRLAHYTDTWTCHLHTKSKLTTHTDITPPHPSRHCFKPHTHSPPTPPTPPQPKHRHTSNTPLFPLNW